MECNGCGNKEATMIVASYIKGRTQIKCNGCSTISHPSHSDVFWPGYAHKNPNLCDREGNPITLTSREHKAQVMREQGVIESGDKLRGAPYVPGRKPGDYKHGKKR